MRNTAEYEGKLRNARRNKRMEALKRKGTAIYDKVIKPFAKASKADAKLHAKILNIELPLEPEEKSFKIKNPPNNISTINLEQKPEKSPADGSHSSSYCEENSQCIHLKNQEVQSQSNLSGMQEKAEQPRYESHSVLDSPTAERFLTRFVPGNVRMRKRMKTAKD